MSSITTSKTTRKLDYIQPSSSNSYDSSQSPLALLAKTCSNIGKDCSLSLSSNSNSTNELNREKTISSLKRSLPSEANLVNTNKKPTISLKSNNSTPLPSIKQNILSNYVPSRIDPSLSSADFLLRSSLAYLTYQQNAYLSSCPIPGCLQCEIVRDILTNSTHNQPFMCNWMPCNTRLASYDQLNEHMQHHHKNSKFSNQQRYHPYLKPSIVRGASDQSPFFYPHLSLSSMKQTTSHTNNIGIDK